MIPTLLLTPDESRDRSGPVTPTLTGPDRVRDGAWWLEEGTTNLIPNPDVPVNVDGWGGSTSNVARSWLQDANVDLGWETIPNAVRYTWSGPYTAGIVGPTSIDFEPEPIRAFTNSMYVRGSGAEIGHVFQLGLYGADGWYSGSQVSEPMDGSWIRLVGQASSRAGDSLALPLFKYIAGDNGYIVDVTGAQLEEKDHATSFTAGTRAPGTLSAPLTGPLGSVLIRYRENGVVHHAQLAASGTFGTFGTVSISGGTIELGTTREVDVLGVVAHEEALPPDQLQRLEDMPYWSWGGVVPQIGGVRISISGGDLAALVSAGEITWNV